jgi:hypothetical protein
LTRVCVIAVRDALPSVRSSDIFDIRGDWGETVADLCPFGDDAPFTPY